MALLAGCAALRESVPAHIAEGFAAARLKNVDRRLFGSAAPEAPTAAQLLERALPNGVG